MASAVDRLLEERRTQPSSPTTATTTATTTAKSTASTPVKTKKTQGKTSKIPVAEEKPTAVNTVAGGSAVERLLAARRGTVTTPTQTRYESVNSKWNFGTQKQYNIQQNEIKSQIGEYNYNALQQALGRRDSLTQSGKSFEDWYRDEARRRDEAEAGVKALEDELYELRKQQSDEALSRGLSTLNTGRAQTGSYGSSYAEELKALEAELEIARRDSVAAGYITELADSIRFDDIADSEAYKAQALRGRRSFAAKQAARQPAADTGYDPFSLADASSATPAAAALAGYMSDKLKSYKNYQSDTTYREPTEDWTDAERDRFYYLYSRDINEAYEYGQKINDRNKAQSFVEKQEELEDWTTKNLGTKALGTATAVVTTPLAWDDLIDTALEYKARGTVTQRENISAFDAGNIMSAAIAQSMNEKDSKFNRLIQKVGGSGTGDLYQIGLSTLQNMVYGHTLGAAATGASYFAAGTMSAFEDAYARGVPVEKAMTYGLMAGAAESVAEGLNIAALLNIKSSSAIKGMISNALKQGLAEGSEEVATQLMDTLADVIINGDKSRLDYDAQMYMLQGMDPEDAEKQAMADWMKETAFSFISGAASGALSGGIETGIQNRRQYQGDVQALIDEAMLTPEGSTARATAQEYAERIADSGEKGITNREALRLQEQTERSVKEVSSKRQKEAIRQEARNKLIEAGYSEAEAGELADIISRRKTGEKISRAELQRYTGNEKVLNIGRSIDARALLETARESAQSERDTLKIENLVAKKVPKQVINEKNPTVKTDDGEAKLTGLSYEDGEVKLNLKWADGSMAMVSQADAELPEDVQSFVVQVSAYKESAPVMFGSITPGQDMSEYLPAWTAAEQLLGRNTTLSLEAAKAQMDSMGMGGVLSEGQFKLAFEEGRRRKEEDARRTEEQAKTSRADKESGTSRTPSPTKNTGTVSYEGGVVNGVKYHAVDRDGLNQRQRKQIAAVELLAEKTGIDFVFYESQADREGNLHGANGIYSNGTIYLDVNAGINSKRSMKQIAIVRAAAHELTHYMQQYAQAQYEELKSFMLEHLIEYEGKDFNELVDEKMARDTTGKLTYAEALDEIVADGCEMMLRRTKVMQAMAEEKPSLFETIKEWLSEWIETLKAAFEGVEPYHREARSMLYHMEQLQEMWDRGLAKAVTEPVDSKNTATEGGVQMQARERYDYSKSFTEQVEDYKQGKLPQYDTLIVGPTPTVLQNIGFNALPVTFPKKHLKDILSGNVIDHDFGEAILKQLPEKIKEPVAVIASRSNAQTSLVVLLDIAHGGKQIITPVVIDGQGEQNGLKIDSNAITSMHKRGNAVTGLLANAIKSEQAGNVAVYYLDNKKTSRLMQGSGLQLPGRLMTSTGYIHSIRDVGSTVKPKMDNVTQSKQFKDWFGNWEKAPKKASKIVDEDGKPLVVYHGTDADFEVFQSKDGTYWFSKNEDYAEEMAHERGGDKIISAYLNMRNPYYAKLKPTEFSNPTAEAPIIRAAKAGGHDGIIIENDTDNPLMEETFYVVFSPEQIKGTDNIGTFDKENPKYQFSERDIVPDDRELLMEAATRPGAGEELTAYRKKVAVLEKLERRLTRLNAAEERDEAKISETEKKMANAEEALSKMENAMKREIDHLRGEWRTENATEAAKAMRQLNEENASLKRYLDYWKKQARLTAPEDRTVLPEDIGKLAKAILEEQGSEADFNSVREQLQELGDYLVSNGNGDGINFNELKAMARAAAREIIQNTYVEETDTAELRNEIRSYLKNTRLEISDELRGELGEDYNYFRKKHMGTLILAKDGRAIDSAYEELSDSFGNNLFPRSVTGHLEQLEQIIEVLDGLQPSYHQMYSKYEQRELTELLSNEIIDRVMSGDVREFKSKADRLYVDMKRRLDEATGELKQVKADKAEDIRSAVQKAREKANERALRRQKRINIDKMAKQLSRYMTENSATKKIPEPMKKSIGEFLLTIDMQYNPESAIGKDYIQRMQDVAMEVYKLQNEDSINLRLDLGSGFADMLNEHIAKVKELTESAGKDWKISELGIEELQELEDILKTIRQSVKTSNELIANSRGEKLSVLAAATIKHLQSLGKLFSRSKTGNAIRNFVQWNNTTPYYFFKRMGPGGEAIFKELQEGWGKLAFNAKEIIDLAEKTYKPEDVKKAEETIISAELHRRLTEEDGGEELRSKDREKVYMTKAQAMELYALSRRTQGLSHILGAGIKISDFKDGKGRVIQQADNYLLDIEDIANITNKLTEREKEIALEMQKHMNNVGSNWGNEVSLKRHGIKQFTEPAYWPIHTDRRDSGVTNPETENTSLYRLMNMGFTKKVIKDAHNAVVIGSAFATFSNHMADMAKYNALVLPMLDAMKFFSYSEVTGGEGGKQYTTESVQKSAERAYGTEAKKYFIQFMKDMNAAQEGGRGEEWYSKMLSNAKVAAVGANLRVAMLQPTSYVRALDVLDGKYLLQGMNLLDVNAGIEEALEHSGTAVWKSLGFYDTNINSGLRDMIKRDETLTDTIRDKSMWLAEKADQKTWGALWNACKAQVQNQQHLSGEELLKATAELFDEVIYRTQVMDSTMTRSHNMRQKGVFAGMTMAFMSEPTLSYNMLLQAYMDFNAALRSSNNASEAWQVVKQPVKRALITYVAAASVGAMVESLADAFRDDDEYQSFGQKWLEALFGKEGDRINGNLVGNLMISNKLPLVKDFVSLLQGYESSRMDTEWMTNIVNVYQIWKETIELQMGLIDEPTEITYNGNMTAWGKIYQTLKALSQASGLPAGNAARDVVALYNFFLAGFTGRPINTYSSGPKSEIKYAVSDGYMDEAEATRLLLEQGLVDDEDEAYWLIQEWQNGDDYSKYDSLLGALSAGDKAAFDSAAEELTEHGLKEKDVESKARNTLKLWYQGDEGGVRVMPDKQKVIRYLQEFAGMDAEDAKALVEEWTCKVVTGIDYNEIKTAYIDGDISESRAQQLKEDYGGYTEDEAKADVTKWKCEKDTGIVYDEIDEAFWDGEISGNKAVEMYIKYGGKDQAEAEALLAKLEFVDGEDDIADISVSAVQDYNDKVKSSGISTRDFYTMWKEMNQFEGDKDEEGKTINGSLKAKILEYIDSLDLTPAQKDALYRFRGWSEKNIGKAPWNN